MHKQLALYIILNLELKMLKEETLEVPVIDLAHIKFLEDGEEKIKQNKITIERLLGVAWAMDRIKPTYETEVGDLDPYETTVYDRDFSINYENLAEKIRNKDFKGKNINLADIDIYQFSLLESNDSDDLFRDLNKFIENNPLLASFGRVHGVYDIPDFLFMRLNALEDVIYACHNYKSIRTIKGRYFDNPDFYKD